MKTEGNELIQLSQSELEKLRKWIAILDKLYPDARGRTNSLAIKLDLYWLSVQQNGYTTFVKKVDMRRE